MLKFSLVILAIVIYTGLASIGDRSTDYNYCLRFCIQKNCSSNPASYDTLSWQLRLFRWTCEDDCRYSCMHQVTSEDVKASRPIRQFYGKVWKYWEWISDCTLFIFTVAICTIPGHSGASVGGILHTELSKSFIWFLSILSKGTKGLSLLVDCLSRPIGKIYNSSCQWHMWCIYVCRLLPTLGYGQ